MCNSFDDVIHYFKNLWTPTFYQLDQSLPPLPWNEESYQNVKNKKLTIGYLCHKDSDGKIQDGMEYIPISKATKRILKESKDRLEAEGHTLVPFIVNDERVRMFMKTYGAITCNNLIPGLAAL